VEISAARENGDVKISVRDYGSGIPDQFRDRMFQKFAQADSSDTRHKSGTGLGLSIVKAIVEKHGGTISFDSRTGDGTTFYFCLPEYVESASLRPPEPPLPSILIVEDNRDVARLLQMMLAQGGFESDVAYDRAQALTMLRAGHYTALTLDLMLGEDDGIAFIRELRADEATRDVPIVVVSVLADEGELRMNGDAMWVADWLQKPIDQEQLVRAVRNAAGGTRQRRPRILHVEDDVDVVRVVQAILLDAAEVTAATTVGEARALLEQGAFDLVILDAVLPDGSGVDLIPLLNRNGARTPVVIFSAQENDAQILDRVNASLVKSRTSNEQLLRTITQLIPPQDKGVMTTQPKNGFPISRT
jgi:DNA-binding response OmpR family regulator